MDKVNLLGFNRHTLANFFEDLGEKPTRASQVLKYIHQDGLTDLLSMVGLNHQLRHRLNEIAELRLPEVITCKRALDGTLKWLLKLACGNCIETVFIPQRSRGTLCVSSQVGCALNCSFCTTGKQGFNRNLSTAEIIAQVWIAKQQLSQFEAYQSAGITNVVMMGMGEPLLNFDNVVSAMDIMLDDFGYGLSKRRVTLSTAGVVPALLKLKKTTPVALAVSLHAPTDELRNQLVPLNRKYPLQLLLNTCKYYFMNEPRRKITFEYVSLAGVNDQPEHVQALIKLLSDIPAKVNLIPFNTFPGTAYRCSSPTTIKWFCDQLVAHGIPTTIRKTRGFDINAACGLLAGKFSDKTNRSRRAL